jgi:hypothetical protein
MLTNNDVPASAQFQQPYHVFQHALVSACMFVGDCVRESSLVL